MKLSRVEIITGISKIEPLKKALGKFHITGMTVYQVLGCGVQHGTQEFEVEEKNKEISLLPKEVVMIVLPTEELDGLLEFVKKELYTGHIGDGKEAGGLEWVCKLQINACVRGVYPCISDTGVLGFPWAYNKKAPADNSAEALLFRI